MRCCALSLLLLFLAGDVVDASTQDAFGVHRLLVYCDSKPKLALVLAHENDEDFDFLRIPRSFDEPVDVLVTADGVNRFKDELRSNNIGFEVLTEDVSQVPQEETRHDRRKRYASDDYNIIDFKSYPRYQEIQAYLEIIDQKYRFVKYKVLGFTFENRQIMGIKFSSGGEERKPAVFIDAGIHAREWIAPTTALYAIKQLAENASNYHLFQNVDIYIIPLANPDGYEYTHYNQTTKYWRKTRTVYNFTECLGADANRNFELEWMTVGASDRPCSGTYAGSRPFSEAEARAIRDFILARRDRIVVYLTLHSFGQYFLHPWGFTTALPANEPTLRCTANAALNELRKVRGTEYKVGSSTNVLYAASGGSDDWAMGIAGIPIVFTIELPPLPGNIENFFPPVKEIEPVGRETFEAIKVFIRYANGEVCTASQPLQIAPSQVDDSDRPFTVTP
ncbi:carboxypeptidase B-like [Phymastichus coffea]|uniref:carboxypeptidase B-like n=1 Tax=Phymastichus coffea TaxID=108790 RepID=UPI00273CDEB1|nr:carboxypeptidase B-like [Phymastichus coffea]